VVVVTGISSKLLEYFNCIMHYFKFSVLDLTTADGKKVTEIDAHDSEVICLEYSRTDDGWLMVTID
jgi:hypothetical protein